VIVKIGLDGRVYVDRTEVSPEELTERVAALNRSGGALTYYRESPETDGSEAAAAAFGRLIELRPAIRLGHEAPSEWGRLEWVELEEAPFVSRFFLARGEKFLISMPPTPSAPKPPLRVGGPLPAELEDGPFDQIDLLVRSDRVMETPPHQPELTLGDSARSQPSLHLRIGYERARWASWYPIHDVPSHIASFHQDLWRVAGRFVDTFDPTRGRELGPDEAREFFR
jgi:hypothetical protein